MSSLVWRLLAGQTSATTNTSLFTWGSNSYGVIGNNSAPTYYSWSQISAGGNHTLALRSDGILFGWGYNSQGQLGDGTTLDRSSPVQISAANSWIAIGTGYRHSVAIKSDYSLWGWGNNTYGQLANYNVTTNLSNPSLISNNFSFTQVSAGAFHNIALTSTGSIYTWGLDTTGQLGDRKSYTIISHANAAAAAIRNDNTLWVWGQGAGGITGLGDAIYRSSPVQLPGSWSTVSVGFSTMMGIKTDGTLWAWGEAVTYGALGDGTVVSKSSPTQIGTLSNWVGVAGGAYNNFMWNSSGVLFATGRNNVGQLGDGTVVTRSSPVQVAGFNTVGISKIVVNADDFQVLTNTYVLLNDNTLWAWGGNESGALGLGNTITRSYPTQIPGRWLDIAAGPPIVRNAVNAQGIPVIGLKTDYTVWAWGNNNNGALGLGDTISRSSPVQIGTSSWTNIYSAGQTFYGFLANNTSTLYGWGYNGNGQLGDNTTTNKSSPVQVTTFSSNPSLNTTPYAIQYFGSGNKYNAIAYSNTQNLASFDFTIEAMIYPTTSSTLMGIVNNWQSGGQFGFEITTGDLLRFFYTNSPDTVSTISFTSIRTISPNVWTHVAVVRTESTMAIYINGVIDNIYYCGNDILYYYQLTGKELRFGVSSDAAGIFQGYISNLRIVKGYTVYQGQSFTINLPLSAVPGTLLLTGRYSTIIDGSTNNWTITSSASGTTSPAVVNTPVPTYTVQYTSQIRQFTGNWQIGTLILLQDGSITEIGGSQNGRSSPVQVPAYNPQYQPFLVKVGNSSYTSVAAGKYGTAAIRSDGKLFTWGLNAYGQLGDSSTVIRSSPVQIGTFSWNIISLNGSHSAAIRSDNRLFTWGINNYGQLANNYVFNDVLYWSQIADGSNHVLGIRSDGALFTWGQNNAGQLGDGTTINRSSPVQIGSSSWLVVSGGLSHTLAIRSDSTLWGWGSNVYGQLGLGEALSNQVSFAMVAFQGTGFVLRNDGTLYAWGYPAWGSLAENNITNQRSYPVQIISDKRFTKIAGNGPILAVRNDGTLWGWGYNVSGGIGDGTTIYRSSPVQVPVTYNIREIYSGAFENGGLIDTSYRLYVWGRNVNGVLGDGTTISRSSPVQIPGSWSTIAFGQGTATTFGIRTDGTLWGWGDNSSGGLGQGNTIHRSSPVQIGFSSYIAVDTGSTNTVAAITTDNRLFVWGSNTVGQLGTNDTISRSSPVQIAGSYSQVRVDESALYFIKTDGTLWATGNNTSGQLGDNTTVIRSSPVQIGTNSDSWTFAGTSSKYSTNGLAINKGILYIWGVGTNSQIVGNNNLNNRSSPVQLAFSYPDYSSPVQIGTQTNWFEVAAGGQHSIAVNRTGDLYGWGRNIEGQLGNIPNFAATSWRKITGGWVIPNGEHVIGLSSGNYLFGWGLNSSGQLGDGTTSNRSSPVQIGGETYIDFTTGLAHTLAIRTNGTVWGWGTNTQMGAGGFSWAQVYSSSEASHAVAIRTDNTVWTWGLNSEGQLGDNTTVSRSSPVQLWQSPSTNNANITWSTAVVGKASTYVLRGDGVLFAFGRNNEGQLGDVTTVNRSSPVQVTTNSNFRTITAGGYVAGFINSSGTLFFTGLNSAGQMGLNDTVSRSSPTQINTSSYSQVSTSASHTLAIRSDSTLWTWGLNTDGQLGDSLTVTRSSPVQVIGSWSVVSASLNNSYAIDSTSRLFAWGLNNANQLADSTIVSRSSPVQIAGSYISVIAGNSYAMAIDTNKLLYGWGLNTSNQTVEQYNLSSLAGTTAGIAVNRAYTWGPNTYGQIGDNTTINRSQPTQIGNDSWILLSTEGSNLRTFTLGIKSNYTLWAWGRNNRGQLGDNTTIDKSSPVQIPGSWSVVRASRLANNAVDGYFSVGINTQGQLYVWGDNNYSSCQLGTGDNTRRSSPTQIGTSVSWSQIDAGSEFTLGITTAGQLYGWGNNTWGAINNAPNSPIFLNTGTIVYKGGQGFAWGYNTGAFGDGTTANRSAPAQINAPTSILWKALSSNTGSNIWTFYTTPYFTGIRADDNTLWSSGNNQWGQLGDGTTVSKSNWTQVGTDTDWATLASITYKLQFAIKTNGRLYGWGDNTNGVIGDGTTISRSSPVQIGSDTNWLSITTDGTATFGLKTDGTLYAWGTNTGGTNGNLGDNTTISRSSPIQISGSYIQVSNFNGSRFAIKSDYTLWGWGRNDAGQVGDNTTITRSSPVQIPGSWLQVNTTGSITHGLRSDRTLWVWGGSDPAQGTGANSTINRSSPVQVGTSSWNFIGGNYSTRIGQYVGVAVSSFVAWGYNQNGNIGDNTTVDKSSPVVVNATTLTYLNQTAILSPTLIDSGVWSAVAAGMQFSAAIRSDSTLWTWGRNTSGELGSNITTFRSSPVQIASTTVNRIAAADGALAYINSSSQLFTVGSGPFGLLGSNATTNRSSPVQVGTSLFTNVWASSQGFSAQDINNRTFAWGQNANGQLGDNTTVTRSSPVQIGVLNQGPLSTPTQIGLGTSLLSWNQVSTGLNASYGINNQTLGYAWGLNNNGQLAQNDTLNRSSPTYVLYSVVGGDRSSPTQVLSGSWSSVMALNYYGGTAIRNDKTLWVWGLNTSGELGDSTTLNRSTPIQIPGSWNQIATGQNFTAGLKSDNTLWVWGNLLTGLLGNMTQTYRSSPSQVGTSSWSSIAAGASHLLALSNDNKIYAWGLNTSRQLGITAKQTRQYTQMTTGEAVSFGINSLGQLYAWGAGNAGTQAGFGWQDNGTGNKSSPVQIGVGNSFIQLPTTISTGQSHMLVVDSNKNLWAWGLNTSGQLGDGTLSYRSSPVQISSLAGISLSKIICSTTASYALAMNGTLYAWGNNSSGQLGQNDTVNRSSPVIVSGIWIDVAAAGNFASGLKQDGTWWAWGDNTAGQAGQNDVVARSSPVQLTAAGASGKTFTSVTATSINNQIYGGLLALTSDNIIVTVGLNTAGELGLGNTVSRSSPVQLGAGWKAVIGRSQGAFGITVDNKLYGWGGNSQGTIGDGTNITKSSPVIVLSGVTNFSGLFVGALNNFLNTPDGAIYYWGYNVNGILGNNSTTSVNNPTIVGNEQIVLSPVLLNSSSYTIISAVQNNSSAIRSDSTLWVWGDNSQGQLGQSLAIGSGFYNYKSSFTFTGTGMAGFQQFGLSSLYTWAAGKNTAGNLGDTTTVSKSSPVQITITNRQWFNSPTHMGTSSYSVVSAGLNYNLLLDTNYNLWGIGDNTWGQIGDGFTVSRSSPVQVGTSSWAIISAGYSNAAAITIDNTLFVWGINTNGQVGDSTTTSRSSPVQVPGIWLNVQSGSTETIAINYNNSLFAWGASSYGALNTNTLLPRSSPVQVGVGYYKDIAMTDNSVTTMDLYGNLWSFGDNQYGQLGNNNA